MLVNRWITPHLATWGLVVGCKVIPRLVIPWLVWSVWSVFLEYYLQIPHSKGCVPKLQQNLLSKLELCNTSSIVISLLFLVKFDLNLFFRGVKIKEGGAQNSKDVFDQISSSYYTTCRICDGLLVHLTLLNGLTMP